MPSITRRRPREPDRRAAVEAQVLAATKRLLTSGAGFTELGVQQIAAEAGVARSTFYLYFRDKSDLLIHLAGDLKEQVFTLVADWRPTGPTGGPDALAAAYANILRFYRGNVAVLTAVNEAAAYDPVIRDFWDGQLARFAEVVAARLSEEQGAGRLGAGLDPVAAARVIVWGGERVIARHVALDDGSGDAALARELALQQWHGAYRRPAEGSAPGEARKQGRGDGDHGDGRHEQHAEVEQEPGGGADQ
jgi:AcrR family transcriptional regulator